MTFSLDDMVMPSPLVDQHQEHSIYQHRCGISIIVHHDIITECKIVMLGIDDVSF
jgi:hypothetical protein